jgi:hypothetical protein
MLQYWDPYSQQSPDNKRRVEDGILKENTQITAIRPKGFDTHDDSCQNLALISISTEVQSVNNDSSGDRDL